MRVVLVFVCGFYYTAYGFEILGSQNPTTEATYEDVLKKWDIMEDRLINRVDSLVSSLRKKLEEYSMNFELSDDCTTAVLQFYLDVKDLKPWTTRMLDSSGKPSGGQMEGGISALGNYDECLKIVTIDEEDFTTLFRGQYCLVDIRTALPKRKGFVSQYKIIEPLNNFTAKTPIGKMLAEKAGFFYDGAFRVGICVPSSCTKADIQNVLESFTKDAGYYAGVYSCEIQEDLLTLDGGQIAVIIIMSSFVLAVFFCSLVDIFHDVANLPSLCDSKMLIVRAFSLRRNLKRLFSVSRQSEETENRFSSFHGLRFISICWVVLCHTSISISPYFLRSTIEAQNIIKNFPMQFVVNGYLSVETFFFISSVIFSYMMIKAVENKGPIVFNIPVAIIRRIWRLLPSALLMIGLALLLPFFSSGPLWKELTNPVVEACKLNWWGVLIFAHNFQHPGRSCLLHLWYVSADLQFFVVGIIYLTIYFRNKTLAKIFLFVLITGSILATGVVSYHMGYPPTAHAVYPDTRLFYDYFYYNYLLPYNHVGVYAIGLSLGTALAKSSKIKIPKTVQGVGWILAVFIGFASIYVQYVWNVGRIPTLFESVVYNALNRTTWALSLTWVAMICATGRGGFVNDFLSWKVFQVLNKTSYLLYLVHVLVIHYYSRSLSGTVDSTIKNLWWTYLGNLSMSYMVAVVLNLIFESPLTQLDKIYFERLKTKLLSNTIKKTNIVEINSNSFESTSA